MASERRSIRSSESSGEVRRAARFVVCVDNTGYAASLEMRKIYQVLPDEVGSRHHQLRVIDESGEDYLYPEQYFAPVRLPHSIEREFGGVSMGKTCSSGLDDRCRDEDGEIRRKRGDTLVRTLRKEYGDDFARGFRSNTKLDTVLRETDSASLSDYLKHRR